MLELTSTARKVLNDRYLLKDKQGKPVETVEDMFRRVAKAVSMAELDFPVELPASDSMDSIRQEQEDIFYNTMINMEFLPNTPTLINAGRSLGQLSACFVLPIEDNMRSIFNSVTNAALIHQSGGGTGFSFSNIRPRGAKVSTTGGQASGPLSFMQVYNTATDCVKQGGTRRGANMGCLRIDHPDILEFLDCKLDLTKFNNFNLSVSITDEFMQAVAGTLNYHPSEPEDVWLSKWREGTRVDSEAYHYMFALRHNDEVYAYVDARYLWNKIVHNAWSTGEPGLLFIDKINKLSPTYGHENIESCNPCVTGDTLILTDKGYLPISDLTGVETNVWDGDQWVSVIPYATGYHQQVYRVSLSNGLHIDCTEGHNWITWEEHTRGGRISRTCTKDLKVGGKLAKFGLPHVSGDAEFDSLAYTSGFYTGNGTEDERGRQVVYLYGDKREVVSSLYVSDTCDQGNRLSCVCLLPQTRDVPMQESLAYKLSWLAGYIDSNGSVSRTALSMPSADKDCLQNVLYLLNTLGVAGSLLPGHKAYTKAMPDGEYACQATWRITVPLQGINCLERLQCPTQRVPLQVQSNRYTERFVTIASIEDLGIADMVYCMTVPTTHCFVANGVLTGNCGEQPLLSYESCNLGSINLVKCINPETVNFDSEVLKRIVRVAVRFLDNVISVNKYPLDEITETTLKYRKIGLGVMGWADTLYLLGLPYDSEKAQTLGSEIMEIISTAAVEASTALAEVRGPFPKYEEIKYNCELLYGTSKPLRNAALTTIAPTGTLSIIAGVSSGIEPVFAPIVRRHILNDEDFLEEDKYFIQQLCRLLKSNVTTFDGFESRFREVCEYVSKTGSTRGILSAYENAILCSASDVTPMGHISMQDAFQKFTHNAISKTVNLPSSATKEDVALVYKVAYESSCKGVTVYRDGCRANQVMNIVKGDDTASSSTTPPKLAVNTESTQEIITEVIAASPKVIRESATTVAAGSSPNTEASPQSESTNKPGVRVGPDGFIIPRNREKKLSGETTCVKTGCGKLYVTINHDTYGVAEIFTSTSKGGGCTSQSEAAARLASIGLRAGIAPAEIISQLRGIRCPSALKRDGSECTSCPDAIAGCLREYYLHYPALSSSLMHIKDSAHSNSMLAQRDSKSQPRGETSQGICEFCGAQMAFESGCRVCYSCGNSHCG